MRSRCPELQIVEVQAMSVAQIHDLNVARKPRPHRVAMLSVHTSPLHQPGVGDAGGMNVYVVELAKRLAERNVEVEVFTRATASDLAPVVELSPGVVVRHVVAGPFEGLAKNELPGQLCTFAREVLRTEAMRDQGWYDLVHSHYWLSGQVGALASDRWGVPLVHSMHTMGKVKNLLLAAGDAPEPIARLIGEEQVVEAADVLMANTHDEARQLVDLYGADPTRIAVVNPGVDLEVFRPQDQAVARSMLGLARDSVVLLFVGRIQPLKAPDVVLHAAAELLRRHPELRTRLVVPLVGGPSGSGLDQPHVLSRLARTLGLIDVVRFVPPIEQSVLAWWFAAATTVVVPSYNESFGLVALEAQATGTPVVGARVGGLTTAVRDGETGLLVAGHDPADYADALERIVFDDQLRQGMSEMAVKHASGFGWADTAARTLDAYVGAMESMRDRALALAE
jgi:D-inositol-3-phosphate glycosyltransferase